MSTDICMKMRMDTCTDTCADSCIQKHVDKTVSIGLPCYHATQLQCCLFRVPLTPILQPLFSFVDSYSFAPMPPSHRAELLLRLSALVWHEPIHLLHGQGERCLIPRHLGAQPLCLDIRPRSCARAAHAMCALARSQFGAIRIRRARLVGATVASRLACWADYAFPPARACQIALTGAPTDAWTPGLASELAHWIRARRSRPRPRRNLCR